LDEWAAEVGPDGGEHRPARNVVTRPAARSEGYAPIGEYAVLTDGRTSALYSRDGRIDWWPVPTLDAPPVCGAVLDAEHGGYLSVAPVDDYEIERRYVEGTNVLESVLRTSGGSVRITTSLNMALTGRLPWTELAFRIEGVSGVVAMEWRFVPGTQLGETTSTCALEQDVPVIRMGAHTMAIRFDADVDVLVSKHEVSAQFEVKGDHTSVLAILATEREPLYLPSLDSIDKRVDDTKENWRRWTSLIPSSGPWHTAVTRSALVLKTLLAEYTGAIAAAATTSLPERIGGDKNWDYRFAWVRDSSYAIDALINLELAEEVHNAVAWLLRAIQANGPELHVFYTLQGELSPEEENLPVPGYRGSQPVRSGNDASTQLQLGNYGDVLDAVYRYLKEGNVLDTTSQQVVCEIARQCVERWREPDAGIWELKEDRHYTISKIGCWVAMDRLVELFDMGHLPGGDVERWRSERHAIREFIEQRCWSATKGAYTFYAGTDDLDASVLLSARTGFDIGERLASTVEAVIRELGRGPLLYRYSGAEASEGAFVACTFWMIEALAALDQRARATEWMDQAVALANDVGIFSEQIDPETRTFLGNVPQALSHLALINAAHALENSGDAHENQAH
jgi:GH15 family glucan-1,4-alpha-glucosidase